MTPPVDDRGPHAAPPAVPLRPLAWRHRLLVYATLQVGGLLALAAAALLVAALAPLFGTHGSSFLRQWMVAFLVVPLTFVPALVLWHRWALARFGKRGGLFRLVAELAFASELIGCVLIQRIA